MRQVSCGCTVRVWGHKGQEATNTSNLEREGKTCRGHPVLATAGDRGEAEGHSRKAGKARNGVGKRKRRAGSKRINGVGRPHAAMANGAAAAPTGAEHRTGSSSGAAG